MNNQLKCTLHNQPFALYCDRCLELICHKCTLLGPHNSSLHSVCQIPQAYERRVEEVNKRLNNLQINRDLILTEINFLIITIETFKNREKRIISQNQKHQTKLLINLTKSYQKIANNVAKTQQELYEQINLVNDLGHQFQSLIGDVETVINYPKIITQLKQLSDNIQMLLKESSESVIIDQLPKELTILRVKFQQIDSLQEIYAKKQAVLKQLVIKLEEDLKKIEAPVIDYQGLLAQLNQNLSKYEGQGSICYFCGIIMNNSTINSICQKNQLNEQILVLERQRGVSNKMLDGFGIEKPENSKFGTHRHYFCEPSTPNKFYRMIFYDQMLQKTENQQNNKKIYAQLQEERFNKNKGLSGQNFFSFYLDALFLKIKTLQKIRKKILKTLFEKQDASKTQNCDRVALEYILVELIGITAKQAQTVKQILRKIKKYPDGQIMETYQYSWLLQKLDQFYI